MHGEWNQGQRDQETGRVEEALTEALALAEALGARPVIARAEAMAQLLVIAPAVS